MNQTIWKYTLDPANLEELSIPKFGHILAVEAQNNKICLWVMVDPSQPEEKRLFSVYGTDHVIENAERKLFIGTAQLEGGMLVFHVFEDLI